MNRKPRKPKPSLPSRIKRAKSRVRELVSDRPRENVDIRQHKMVQSYLIHTCNVALSLSEWSNLMLRSLRMRERSYGNHLSTTSREKKWSPAYNKWLLRQLKIIERRKKFWEARAAFAGKLEWQALNGLRLVRPSPELKLVVGNIVQKQSRVARAKSDWEELSQKIKAAGKRTYPRVRAKEYWEVALRRVESLLELTQAQRTTFEKYALSFSPHKRGVLKRQMVELQRIARGIRSTIQELDRGEEDEGREYAFI